MDQEDKIALPMPVEQHDAGRTEGEPTSCSIVIGNLLSRLWLVLTALGSSPPLYFGEPLGRPAPSFSLANFQAFQHDDGFRDLIPLHSKVKQHFVDVHFLSVP
jgi:hypothetical protein